jgi:hypothetical protein
LTPGVRIRYRPFKATREMKTMKKLILLLLLAVALFGCGAEDKQAEVETAKPEPVEVADAPRTLEIEWQRMVDEDGRACCGSEATQKALENAYAELSESLGPKGIEVELRSTNFSPEECMGAPEQANRILIAGHSIAHWLNADVGTSPCQGFCKQALGDKGACQTLIYEGEAYEVAPAELIVKAGLLAAAQPGSGHRCSGCPHKSTCGGNPAACDGSCQGGCKHSGSKGTGQKGTCSPDCPGKAAGDAKASGCPNAGKCSGKVCTVGS